jgi:hypothetical protein
MDESEYSSITWSAVVLVRLQKLEIIGHPDAALTFVKNLVVPVDRSFTGRSSCGTRLAALFDPQVSELTRKT